MTGADRGRPGRPFTLVTSTGCCAWQGRRGVPRIEKEKRSAAERRMRTIQTASARGTPQLFEQGLGAHSLWDACRARASREGALMTVPPELAPLPVPQPVLSPLTV